MSDPISLFHQEIADHVPEWGPLTDNVRDRVFEHMVRVEFGHSDTGRAVRHILHQFANTFLDLLRSADAGAGREALMGSRVLFELLVSLQDVALDPALAERYIDYLAVVEHRVGCLDLQLSVYKGNALKAARHHLDRGIRNTKVAYDAAVTKHGSDFQRGWHNDRLLDRATKHRLDKYYELYRVASSLQHGSIGGSLGSHRASDNVYRIGPALLLTPLALLYAIEFARLAFTASASLGDPSDLSDLLRALSSLKREWPRFLEGLVELDSHVWPSGTPVGFVAIAGVSRTGKTRWFVHDTEHGLVAEADQPTDLSNNQVQALDKLREKVRSRPNEVITGPLGLFTAAMAGVNVKRKPGARWQLDTHLLPQTYGLRPEPREGSLDDLFEAP